MKKRSLLSGLPARLLGLVYFLCVIQPIMDVFSYWLGYGNGSTLPTLILRFAVLAASVTLGFLLSDKKRTYLILAAALLALTLGHVAVCLYYGYNDPLGDLTNLMRIYQLPLLAFSLITFCKKNRHCLKAILAGCLCSFLLICLIALFATVTGTDPHTYANKGLGLLGWFATPSAQSAILSMLAPLVIVCVGEFTRWRFGCVAAASLVAFSMLYLFATRLSYAALLAICLGFAVGCGVLKYACKKNYGKLSLLFLGFALLAILLIYPSPMAENNRRVAENARLKQADIDFLVAQDMTAAAELGLTGQEAELYSLHSAYESYLPGVSGRFGLETAAQRYDYSTQASDLADVRRQKNTYCLLLMEEQPLARLFGLELADLSHDGTTYDVENDFHGIFFLTGGAGLLLLLFFLGYFLWRILRALVLDFRRHCTLKALGFGLSLCCGLAHAWFTCGVLRRPNASFYFSLCLAAIYILTNPPEKENVHETL